MKKSRRESPVLSESRNFLKAEWRLHSELETLPGWWLQLSNRRTNLDRVGQGWDLFLAMSFGLLGEVGIPPSLKIVVAEGMSKAGAICGDGAY